MMRERTTHRVHGHTYYGDILAALAVLLAVMLPTGCTDNGLPQEQMPVQEEAIAFSVSTGGDTRATGEIGTTTVLQGSTGFGVFASYTRQWRYSTTTVSPDFLCNQKVKWDDEVKAWTYNPLKYWPNGEGEGIGQGQSEIAHQVSFFAYAPWSDFTSTSTTSPAPANCITDCSQTYEQGDPWVLYRLAGEEGGDPTAQQVDLLYAVCDYDHYGLGDGLCNIDLTKPEVTKRVGFTFNHALGIVGDNVTVKASTDLQAILKAEVDGSVVTAISLVLQSITIDYTLTSKARLMLYARDGKPNWKTVTSENVKTKRRVSITEIAHTLYTYNGSVGTSTDYNPGWTGKGVFYIPIEGDDYVQRASITVGYRVVRTGGTDYSGTTKKKDVILHEQTDYYGPGKQLDFNISLGSSISLSNE